MTVRTCFDADAYNRALNVIDRLGADLGVKIPLERTDLAGQYGCIDDIKGFIVDIPESRYLSKRQFHYEKDNGELYIDPDELEQTFKSRPFSVNSRVGDHSIPEQLEIERTQEDIFIRMLKTYSGRETALERDTDLGCDSTEYENGYRFDCHDIGISVFVKK